MASRQAVRLGAPVATLVLGGAAIVYPRRTIYAEAPPKDALPSKKPIYSDVPAAPKSKPSTTSPVSTPSPTSPTPTDRLTEEVKKARLFFYDQSLAAENGINSAMSWALKKETSFTNTVASLAPAPETGEQLLPGAIYTLVATMAGSIVSRNRGIIIRSTFPLAVGITAGWMLIPVTMRNIADFTWEYEKKVPAISESHAWVSGFTKEAWRQTKIHAKLVTRWADSTAADTRKRVESWVEKGQ